MIDEQTSNVVRERKICESDVAHRITLDEIGFIRTKQPLVKINEWRTPESDSKACAFALVHGNSLCTDHARESDKNKQ